MEHIFSRSNYAPKHIFLMTFAKFGFPARSLLGCLGIDCYVQTKVSTCKLLQLAAEQYQNSTENQNGPYGPYEHILQDRSQDVWTKK